MKPGGPRFGINLIGQFTSVTGILFSHESPLRRERFAVQKSVLATRRIAVGSKERLELGNLSVVRNRGWVLECVEAMWRILQQPKAKDLVVATGTSCSLQTAVAEIFSQRGIDWQSHVVYNPTLSRPAVLAESRANPARAAEIFGWQAVIGMPRIVRNTLEGKIE